jgi:hypothetical protein
VCLFVATNVLLLINICCNLLITAVNSQAIEIENDEDRTERFIQIIQGKPAIYSKRLKEHSGRNITTHIWSQRGGRKVRKQRRIYGRSNKPSGQVTRHFDEEKESSFVRK